MEDMMAAHVLIVAAHVILGTLAFGTLILFDFMLVAIARSRDVRTIRNTFSTAFRYARWFGILLGLAVILGLILAGYEHLSFGSGWLVATYVLIVLAGVIGIGSTLRRHGQVLGAAMRSADDQP